MHLYQCFGVVNLHQIHSINTESQINVTFRGVKIDSIDVPENAHL